MSQSPNMQPLSITYFILTSKNFETVLIKSNKYFYMLLGSVWEFLTSLCMGNRYV